jgi:hypothetical protein
MKHVPTILLLLSFPAGILGYALGTQLLTALALPDLLVAFGSLLIAGLVMMPFLIPSVDRKAKADLAAHAREAEATTEDDQGGPTG